MKKIDQLTTGDSAPSRILVSSKEGADLLGISLSAYNRLRLNKVCFGRRCVRYRMVDIVQFINRRLIIRGSQ
jgi:hypothetical protein